MGIIETMKIIQPKYDYELRAAGAPWEAARADLLLQPERLLELERLGLSARDLISDHPIVAAAGETEEMKKQRAKLDAREKKDEIAARRARMPAYDGEEGGPQQEQVCGFLDCEDEMQGRSYYQRMQDYRRRTRGRGKK